MTASALLCWRVPSSSATSVEAGQIASVIQAGYRHLCASHSFGAACQDSVVELFSVADECKAANWDGQGAAPISRETCLLAYRFIEALPIGTSRFLVGAEPDGHLTLEWYRSPRRILSVSISSSGELHYAALLGLRKRYGTEPFFDEVPKVILDLISETMT